MKPVVVVMMGAGRVACDVLGGGDRAAVLVKLVRALQVVASSVADECEDLARAKSNLLRPQLAALGEAARLAERASVELARAADREGGRHGVS